ncbi:MAG: UDP-N-acetylmuramate dehydrogenase [Vicinamibacterales bacterium]
MANAPLAPLTTFRVGGPADWLVDVETEAELAGVLAAAAGAAVPVTLLGGGSNVLVADAGVRGAVVRARLRGIGAPDATTVRAEAGVTMNGLVRWTIAHGLAALEAWAGTPGTVGGAIFGNAHFQGRDIGALVQRARLLARDGAVATVPRDEMGFAYDTSRLQATGEILVWAEFAVAPGDPDALRQVARASLAFRKRTQPLALSSAGCIFQNPDRARDALPADVPASAGALVDRAGLKHARQGDARISGVHANFIVNEGGATAADVRALIERARDAVEAAFGVRLRDEVRYIGDWPGGGR